jgi:hypothetical protein
VQIHPSARRHDVADEDIVHAFEHSIAWIELDDDPPRYLMAGADRAANMIELVAFVVGDESSSFTPCLFEWRHDAQSSERKGDEQTHLRPHADRLADR